MQIIPIHPHPAYPNAVRTVEIEGKNEDLKKGSVTLLCRVRHHYENSEPVKSLAVLEKDLVLLVADDTSFVNPATGALVPEGTEGAVGQYTFLKNAVEIHGVNPFVLQEAAVIEAATLGRFD